MPRFHELQSFLTLVSPAAGGDEPLTLDDVRTHLNGLTNNDDKHYQRLIIAARKYVERRTTRQFMTAQLQLTLDQFPTYGGYVRQDYMADSTEQFDWGAIELRKPPIRSVDSITYTDMTGAVQTLDPATWQADTFSEPGRILPEFGYFWPITRPGMNRVTVLFTAGYGIAKDVPETAKLAMLLLIGHWNENREGILTGTISSEIQLGVEDLIADLKWTAVMA